MKKLTVLLLGTVMLLAGYGSAHAYSSYLTSFMNTYPSAGTISGCVLCHLNPAGGGPRNGYGTDYANNGHSFAAIENLDSDGDGYSNITEITSVPPTYPGDATSFPAPAACTSFTYSAWGTCQSNNTQTRTVTASSPTGCTGGSPVLTQSCVYVPPVTTCTSFTYSAWGTCQSNSTQTRTVAASSPTGCTGGSPVLTQYCNYVPPVVTCTSFTYSAWTACQSNNTQSRTVTAGSPAGCTGGSPTLTSSFSYVPPKLMSPATAGLYWDDANQTMIIGTP